MAEVPMELRYERKGGASSMQVGMTVLHTLGKALIADPIYQYILVTVPSAGLPPEATEQPLIDFP